MPLRPQAIRHRDGGRDGTREVDVRERRRALDVLRGGFTVAQLRERHDGQIDVAVAVGHVANERLVSVGGGAVELHHVDDEVVVA